MERMKTNPLDVKSQITRLSLAGPPGLNAWLIDFTGHRETETTGCNDFERYQPSFSIDACLLMKPHISCSSAADFELKVTQQAALRDGFGNSFREILYFVLMS